MQYLDLTISYTRLVTIYGKTEEIVEGLKEGLKKSLEQRREEGNTGVVRRLASTCFQKGACPKSQRN
jgi:hypothetical protein